MTVDRNSYPHTVALNGKSYQAPSPVDIDYWKANIIPTVREFAKYSLKHPSVSGIMMDLEMYGFPFLFYSDIHDYSDLAFNLFLKAKGEGRKAKLKDQKQIPPFAFRLSPSRRFDWLMKKGYLELYYKALSWRAEDIGRLYREEIHKINPNLILGFYAGNIMTSWFYLGFWRGASSKNRPIILLTFNTESARNLAIMKREGIYMYHASAALMGKFLVSDFETVIANAIKNGDGYWLNRLTALVAENAHYGEIEAPHDLDANGKWKALHKKEEKYKAIEAIRRGNERLEL